MDNRERMYMECVAFGNMLKRSACRKKNFKAEDDKTAKDVWILMFIHQNRDRDIFQKDIEEAFMLSRSTVSKIITQMEQNGYIIRESVDCDARLKKLTLTKKAMDIYKNTEAEAIAHLKSMTKDLTDNEVEEFIRILKKIQKNI